MVRFAYILFSLLLGLSAAQNTNPHVYPNYQSNREFWTLNGHTADPCVNREELFGGSSSSNNNMLGLIRQDCSGPQLPDPAVTILIPSLASNGAVTAAALTLTMSGRNLDAGAGTGVNAPSVWLAAPGGDCSGTVSTPITGTFDGNKYFVFTVGAAWRSTQMELEVLPRKICYSANSAIDQAVYTGFKIGVVWDCDDTIDTRKCTVFTDATQAWLDPLSTTLPLSTREKVIRAQRNVCIRHTIGDRSGSTVGLIVGQCINPKTTVACQGAAIDPISMKCCDTNFTHVQWSNRPCFCRPDGSSPLCPSGETCCTHTKYPELQILHTGGRGSWPQYFGECYNTTTHRCCDTGYRYDPGQDQCCNITGIQSLNVPCPCQNDADCQGGQSLAGQGNAYGSDNAMICCSMFWPDPYETGDAIISKMVTRAAYPRCNKYINYPSTSAQNTLYPIGTGPYQAQRCLGICIDNRYQTCCNGIACRKEFEACCNSTCCNKFTSICTEGRIPGTPNNRFNYNELDQPYEICTSIEALNPLRGFWLYVWPAYLLLMTAVCSAFSIAFINKVSRRSFSFLERAMIIIAFLTIIFACACYFAPIYKYGVFVVIVNIFTIITASARAKSLNLVLVLVQFITVMYLFDPFTGNNYLGFASIRVANGDPDPESAGILYSIMKCFHSVDTFNGQLYCANYYNYFNKDPQLQDFRRDNMAVPSFGYCGHGWITALYIFEGITIILTLIQFLLNLIALILRYKEERSEEFIRLEPEPVEFTTTTSPVPVVPVSVATPYFPTGITLQ